MNDHKRRIRLLMVEPMDSTSEMQARFQELHIHLNEGSQHKVETKDIFFINDLEYQHNSVERQIKNFQKWKSGLTNKNSAHFGISFFI